jgi:hypothetical protein
MIHDPRLPTLEEVMNGNPFERIDTPWGHIERWRASTLATGTMGALKNVYDIVRSDAAEAAARADADTARITLLQDVLEKLDALSARCDALASENAALKARARDDAARKAKFDQEPVTLPPDLLRSHEPEPPLELEGADKTDNTDSGIGDLPEEIQLPKPLSQPAPEPKGKVQQQPIALFGN